MNGFPIDLNQPNAQEQLGAAFQEAAAEQGEVVSCEDMSDLAGELMRMIAEGLDEAENEGGDA